MFPSLNPDERTRSQQFNAFKSVSASHDNLHSEKVIRNEEKLKKLNRLLYRPSYDGQDCMSTSALRRMKIAKVQEEITQKRNLRLQDLTYSTPVLPCGTPMIRKSTELFEEIRQMTAATRKIQKYRDKEGLTYAYLDNGA